jgi:hypothetical protein
VVNVVLRWDERLCITINYGKSHSTSTWFSLAAFWIFANPKFQVQADGWGSAHDKKISGRSEMGAHFASI